MQAVKAICMILSKIETTDIIKAIRRLLAATGDMSELPGGTGNRYVVFVIVDVEFMSTSSG